jgi:type I restriction enzyme S subunit
MISLGEIITLQRGHDLPSTKRVGGCIPIMGSSGITGYHNVAKCSGSGVIVGRSGNSMGEISFINEDYWPLNTCLYVTDFKGNDPLYIYYLLKIVNFDQFNSGSAQKSLNRNAVYPFQVYVTTDKKIQKEIGKTLSRLETKILINTQTNQTLDEIAQVIFKSWFVDFDPVKAKMLGEKPEGMDVSTAALFPEKFVESELGSIPDGWPLVPIKDLCSQVQNGGTPRRNQHTYWDEGIIPWLTSGEVRQPIITSVENRITQIGLDKSSAKWVPEFSTLVALYGATAGEVSLTSLPLTTNQAVCALIPKKDLQWYNYLQLKSRVTELAGKAVGSAQQNISKGLVESTEVLSVPHFILEAFNLHVDNLFKLRISNHKENIELAKLRDTLLPKLLSGERELGIQADAI